MSASSSPQGQTPSHGAEDVDAPARWRAWFDGAQEGQRRRDEALPFEPPDRGRDKLFKI